MKKQSIGGILVGIILSISFFALLGISPMQLLSAFIDNTELEFDAGTYVGTDYDSGNSWVEISNTTNAIALPDSAVSTGWFDMTSSTFLFHMDDASGSIIDSSGNGYNATNNGATYGATGKLQSAMTFDGSNDYIDVSSVDVLDYEDITSCVWSKSIGKGTGDGGELVGTYVSQFNDALTGYVFDTYDGSSGSNYNDGIRLWVNNTDCTIADVQSFNEWHHVCATYNGGSGATELYLDGVNVKSCSLSTTLSSTGSSMKVGRQDYLTGQHFYGDLDEVSLWDRIITPEEIEYIYNRQSPTYAGYYDSQIFDAGAITDWTILSWTSSRPYSAPLPDNEAVETDYTTGNMDMSDNTHLYHFDETSGVSLSDSSGNSKPATLSSGTVGEDGKFDKSLSLNGSNNYASVSSPSLPTNNFTYTGWINLDENTDETILYASDGTGANELLFNIVGANTMRVRLNNTVIFDGNIPVSVGEWTHFAVTRSGSTVTSYINGVFDDTGSHGSSLNFASCPLLIGVDGDSGGCVNSLGNYFDGRIDELAIFNIALDANTVRDVYLRGALDLGFQVRTCDDAACSGETFTNASTATTSLMTELTHGATTTPSISLSQTANRYFQYRTFFGTDSITYSPELLSVTIATTTPIATWDGGGVGDDWCTAGNWSGDTVPTGAYDVTIDTAVTVTTTACGASDVNFNTLTIGETNTTTLQMGDVTNAISSMTIKGKGIFEQHTSSTLLFGGNITAESGATITHAENGTTHAYSVNLFVTGDIDIQEGASVDVDALGFNGGATNSDGSGPGPGEYESPGYAGGGGGHGGNGGEASDDNVVRFSPGGTAYCDPTGITTMGSGGAGGWSSSGARVGGAGGGLVVFNASGDVTIEGTITADGGPGIAGVNSAYSSGGGAGGGIYITGDTVTGTPQSFTATGGVGIKPGSVGSGAGGGGCAAIVYTTANLITTSTANLDINGGNAGYQTGGGGQMFINQVGNNGDLHILNHGSVSASTTQSVISLSLDNIFVYDAALYEVESGKTLTPTSMGGDGTGVIDIAGTIENTHTSFGGVELLVRSGVTVDLDSTFSLLSNGTLTLHAGAIVSSTISTFNSAGDVNLDASATYTITNLDITAGTFTLSNFSTTTALSLDTLTMSGGTLTNEANTTEQTHIVHVSVSGDMDIQAGGTVSAEGLGYGGGATISSGNGPGPGTYTSEVGGGGSHYGVGGSGRSHFGGVESTTSSAYCVSTVVDTMGSSGAGGWNASGAPEGGAGGGLIILDAAGTATIEGTITADGADGETSTTGGGIYSAGAGAGGGIHIIASTVTGTPIGLNVAGGDASGNSSYGGGGGGGGCVLITYLSANSISSATLAGGAGTGYESGGDGSFIATQLNEAPTSTIGTPAQTIFTGIVSVTTTVSDTDNNDTSLIVEYSTDGISWSSSTLGDITVSEGSIATSTGEITSIDTSSDGSVDLTIEWLASTDISIYDTSVYLRITPNDGITDGATVTSSAFTLDTVFDSPIGDVTISELGTSTITFARPNPTSSDPNFLAYGYYISTSTPALGEGDPDWGIGEDTNLLHPNWNGATSTNATGFTPNTLYYLTFVALDAYLNVTTTPETSTTTYAITPNGVTFGSATTSLFFIWSANGNTTGTVYEAEHIESATIVTTTDTFYEFSNALFSPGERQNFRVRAVNSAGVYTDYATGYSTSGLESPEAPTVSITGTSTLDITFGATTNGVSTTYALYNVTDDNYLDASGVATGTALYQSTSTWGASVSASGLIGNTAYSFETIATLLGSFATSTGSTSTYTYASAPTIVGGLLATSSVQLALINDGGPTTLHDLTNLTLAITVTSSDGIFNITGLTPNTTYFYQARVFNGDGIASASSTSSTVVTYAVPPTTVTATVNSATEISLTWDDSGATQYQVYQDGTLFSSTSNTSTTATSLTCETSYLFAVVALNAQALDSLTSTTVSATTDTCPIESSGGGGGGGFISPSTPTFDSGGSSTSAFVLDNNASTTASRTVSALFTGITNATQMALSNTLDFSDVSFVPYASTFTHLLSSGNGIKTVYAKLRSAQGGTVTLSDTIQLVGQAFIDEEESTTGSFECPLTMDLAYSVPGTAGVYYVTTECTKRPFKQSDIYFTYFTSWSDVIDTTQESLDEIPDDTLGFMPLGPLYNPASGALIKLPDDPKVYLLLGETIYHIANEEAAEFQFGPAWATWIDTVDPRVRDTYTMSSVVLGAETRPDGILIKYLDDPKVYQLDTVDGQQVKRWIPDEETFVSLRFRWDRIVTVPSTETYPDGEII